jgi:hypothetical protein
MWIKKRFNAPTRAATPARMTAQPTNRERKARIDPNWTISGGIKYPSRTINPIEIATAVQMGALITG